MDLQSLEALITRWAKDKDLLVKDNSFKQMTKLMEEVGELARGICKDDIELTKDSIGDSVVVLTILAAQNGLTLTECTNAAWQEIKNRTGKTVNGVFIKQSDLD